MGFGKFSHDYLMPEDPMDWVIILLMTGVVLGGGFLVFLMFSQGML